MICHVLLVIIMDIYRTKIIVLLSLNVFSDYFDFNVLRFFYKKKSDTILPLNYCIVYYTIVVFNLSVLTNLCISKKAQRLNHLLN